MDFNSGGDIGDLYCDGTTVQLNVQDSLTCSSESTAEKLKRLIDIIEFESATEIRDFDVPRTKG